MAEEESDRSTASSPATLRLRRNEKLKARADILNKAAGASLATGIITPLIGRLINPEATGATMGIYIALMLAAGALAYILHWLANRLLDKLEA